MESNRTSTPTTATETPPKLEDSFCPSCFIQRKQKLQCGQRVEYLIVKYNMTREDSISTVLDKYPIRCKKKNNTLPTLKEPLYRSLLSAESIRFPPINYSDSNPRAALCVSIRSEYRYVSEWIDYHLALGFSEIVVSDNSPDNELASFNGQYSDRVQIFSTPNQQSTILRPLNRYNQVRPRWQCAQNRDCAYMLRQKVNPPKWVGFFDVDEFLVLYNHSNVVDFLSDTVPDGAIQINWLLFGTSQQSKHLDFPVTQRFRFRQEPIAQGTKMMVRLQDLVKMQIHTGEIDPLKPLRHFGKGDIYSGCCVENATNITAAVHHYSTKSLEEITSRHKCSMENPDDCPVQKGRPIFEGTLRDDSAWETLTRNLPVYKTLEAPYEKALEQAYKSNQTEIYQQQIIKLLVHWKLETNASNEVASSPKTHSGSILTESSPSSQNISSAGQRDIFRAHILRNLVALSNNTTQLTLPYQTNRTFLGGKVTLVTQGGTSKLDRLVDLASRWLGPISCAIYITTEAQLDSWFTVLEKSLIQTYVSFHVLVEQPQLPANVNRHPVNALRNLALSNVETDHVFLNDVDFMPTLGAHDAIAPLVSQLEPKTFWVLPAFERFGVDKKGPGRFVSNVELIPETKEGIIKAVAHKQVAPFHEYFPPGHAPSNYTRWYTAAHMYSIDYETFYEPYVICHRHGLPTYFQRFRGFGFNKMTFFMEAHYLGFDFKVLPDLFVVHMNHRGGGKGRNDKGGDSHIVKEEFRRYLQQTYGVSSAELSKW